MSNCDLQGPAYLLYFEDPLCVEPSGGFWFDYDYELTRRRKEKEERERLEREAKQIQDRLDRALALEFRKKEAEQSRIDELQRLSKLAAQHTETIQELDKKVIIAAERAVRKGKFSAMEAFEREIGRVREEELFLMMALSMVLND